MANQKYIKPRSLAWWSGVVMLASGIIMAAAEGFPTVAPIAVALHAAWGMDAAPLIAAGLGIIGLRGAIPTPAP